LKTLVRFSASVRLMESTDPEESVFPAWAAVLKGPRAARMELIDVVRVWLLKKRIKASDPGIGVLLRDMLRSEDRDLRLLGLHAVGALKADQPDLLSSAGALAVSDPSPDVRGMACLALGKTGSQAALPHLLKALKCPVWAVRRRAALGLEELEAKEATGDLLTAVLTDPEPAVRGRAAQALGACGVLDGIKVLEAALLDKSELVRFFAAQALVKDFGRADVMEHFFPLMRWKGPLKDRLLGRFLRAYTGKGLPLKEGAWKSWWEKARDGFDGKKHAGIFRLWEEARKIAGEGDEEKAVELYRKIRTLQPGHAGACGELSTILNSRAWDIAVGGGDFEAGLKLAEESVAAKEDGNNIDTLVVLQFLTGRKKKAIETVREALKKYKGREAELLRNRLAEFKKGKLALH